VNATSTGTPQLSPAELEAAYSVCRTIARREAKNFYYAFVALPKPKRNAICAIYAFMRKADDLADDERLTIDARRAKLNAWLAAWHAANMGNETADPIFIAVRDATARYSIPASLLDELVTGVTMDIDAAHGNVLDTYATFDDLYRYCYLVASVVGLVCIRIFGYTDPHAEKLAEETGIAFQLTNILRDVAEDAERNRVYLPLEDLKQHAVNVDDLIHHSKGVPPTRGQRELLEDIAARAERYYRSSDRLLPLIDKDSRPALQVLVRIYHGLLDRIKAADYDVFTRRASVPTFEKLRILALGMTKMAWVRIAR